MDFSLNEKQQLLKKAARDFLEKECPKDWVKKMAKDEKGYAPEIWDKMAGLGWMGLPFPEKYSGTGGDFLDLVVLFEEMGKAGLPGPFFASVVFGGMTLMQAGNEQQKLEFLPQITSGSSIFTLALTEPSAQYTADGIDTIAIAKQGGYQINGAKLFVPDAHVANFVICVAKTRELTNSEKGITLFLVDSKTRGVDCTVLPTIGGDKQCAVVFNKVAVPEENILGGLNQGWSYVEPVLQKATIAKCAEMVGGGQQVLEMTTEYVKTRIQYGQPIGSFQAIQHHCADIAIDVESCRWLAYEAACMLNEGRTCAKEVAMAKAFTSEAYRRLTAVADQCLGAIGMTADHDMPIYYKHAKASQLLLGSKEFHLETVAREAGFIA